MLDIDNIYKDEDGEDKYCATTDCDKYYKPTIEDICTVCGKVNRDLPQDPDLPEPRIS